MLYLCWCFISDVGAEANSKPTENQNAENILQRAVNNPEFIPRSFQQPVHNPAQTSSSSLASAVNAPVFVPGKSFLRHQETAEERLQVVEKFVNSKIKQLIEDPGLLDELSMSMANYLSAQITVENDMIKVSDILFEKVGNCKSKTMLIFNW
jgi:translation elongation factor EF-Ts